MKCKLCLPLSHFCPAICTFVRSQGLAWLSWSNLGHCELGGKKQKKQPVAEVVFAA